MENIDLLSLAQEIGKSLEEKISKYGPEACLFSLNIAYASLFIMCGLYRNEAFGENVVEFEKRVLAHLQQYFDALKEMHINAKKENTNQENSTEQPEIK
jgi:hypothetical protein